MHSRLGLILSCLLVLAGCAPDASRPEQPGGAQVKPDPAAIFSEAQQYELKGSSCWKSDKKTAREHYARFRELSQQAARLCPSNQEYQIAHVIACVKYADCCWHLGAVDEATECYSNALHQLVAVPGAGEAWQRAAAGLFAAYGIAGDAGVGKGDFRAAEGCYVAMETIAKELAIRTPGQKDGSVALCLSQLKLSDTCILRADYDRAEQHLASAEKTVTGATDITSGFFVTREATRQGIQDKQAALAKLRAAAGKADLQLGKADAFHALARQALSARAWGIAQAYFNKELDQRRPFLENGDRAVRLKQVLTYEYLAEAEKEAGKIEAAREHYAASLEVISKYLPDDKDPDAVVAAALSRRGWAKIEESAGKLDMARKLRDAAIASLETLERDGKLDEHGKRVLTELRGTRPKSLFSE